MKDIGCCCENCDNLIAIGEGDHICYEVEDTDGNPCVVPIEGYKPSDEYFMCGGKKFRPVR